MKKTFIVFLIMTSIAVNSVSLFNAGSAYAATTDNTIADNTRADETSDEDGIKVSLESIRDIMIENNLDIKILNNKVKIAKENYNNAKDAKEEADQAKKDASSALKSASAANDGTPDAASSVATASNKLQSAEQAVTAAENSLTNAKNALKTARDNYDKGIEDQVYAAQQAYLNYLYDLSKNAIAKDTAKQNEKKEKIYKLQYENGFISKNKYTSLLQANTSVDDLNSTTDTTELDRIKLCNTLGISPEEKVIFNTDIDEDFRVIAKINYENDLQYMLDNNLEIKLKNDEISDLDDEDDDTDVHDYKEDNADMELKKLKNDKETSFKQKYNELMTSYNSIKSSYDVINQKQKEYEITQIKYDYGYISQNDLDSAKLTLDTDNANFIKKRNECYLSYLKYIEMKEGY